jgi:hypothetical protein
MFGVTEFDQDPETAAELMRLKRKQSIADAMMQSGRVAPQGRMAGRVYVGPSIFEGLGGLAEQYVAKGQMSEAEQGYKALGESRRIMQDNERGKIMEVLAGRPEQPMGPPTEAGEMGVREAAPAGTKEQVMQALASSRLPAYRDAGLKGMIAGITPDWEVAEQYDASGNKQKVLLNKNNPAQTKPFGGASAPTIQYKDVFVEGPKGEPYVQKQVSTDNGKTWTKEGVASPRFAKQVASTVVIGGDEAKYAPVSVVKRGHDGKDDPKLGTELISRSQAIKEKRTLGNSDPTVQGGLAQAKKEGAERGEAYALSQAEKVGAAKALKAAGFDPDTGKDVISDNLDRATGGMVGSVGDKIAGAFNVTTEGKAANAVLESTANKITMDMMGGKLGAGISNADRDFVIGQLGKVGDANEPIGARKAAWKAAKDRLISVGVPFGGKQSGGKPTAPANPYSGMSDDEIKAALGGG